MKKKALSILLCLCMVIGLLPTAALAAEAARAASVTVGGVELDGTTGKTYWKNGDDSTSGATGAESDWNAKFESGTLTLKDAVITGAEGASSNGIYCSSSGDLTIALEGDNRVTGTKATTGSSYGICTSSGSLYIEGGGSLTATGGESGTNIRSVSCGIYGSGSVTISDVTVTATGGKSDEAYSGDSYGIYGSGSVTISGGTVTATGGECTQEEGDSCGVYSDGRVTISDGTVTATGGSSQSGQSHGVYGSGGVSIDGGTVTATGGSANSASSGVYGSGGVSITGGTVTATGGGGNESYGVWGAVVTISDGTVTATGSETGNKSCGIYSTGGQIDGTSVDYIKITGGRVTATGGRTSGNNTYSYGMYGDDVTISAGTVTATGGSAGYASYGVYGKESVTISGAIVTATGGSGGGDSYGVFGNSGVSIDDGTVTATGGKAGNESSGVYSESGVTISNGAVTAIGGESTGSASNSYGVFGMSDVTIRDGTVTAIGGKSTLNSHGMNSNSTITYEGGLLVAKGNSSAMDQELTFGDGLKKNTDYFVTTAAQDPGSHNTTCYVVSPATDGTPDYHVAVGKVTTSTYEPGHIEWSDDTLTLTLTNTVIIDVSADNKNTDALAIPDGGTLNTVGYNVALANSLSYDSYGVYGEGALEISGEGHLIALGGNTGKLDSNLNSYGMYSKGALEISGVNLIAIGGSATYNTSDGKGDSRGVYGNSVTIEAGSTVTALGGTADDTSTGIAAESGALTISDGTVTAIGGSGGSSEDSSGGSSGESSGISGATVEISSDATVTALGGTTTKTSGISSGVDSVGALSISGKSLIALGGTTTKTSGISSGVYGKGALEISGESLIALGGSATGDSGISSGVYGVDALEISGESLIALGGTATGTGTDGSSFGLRGGSVTIGGENSAPTVTALGGKASGTSSGVHSYQGLTISTGTVTATGGEGGSSYGVHSNQGLTISTGTVTATGGKGTDSFGMSSSELTIYGGTVTATGGEATGSSYGVYSIEGLFDGTGTVTISSGTVTVTGGKAGIYSCGVYGHEGVSITDGTVTATGGKASIYSSGVYGDGGVSIDGGTVTATGGKAGKDSSGVYGNNEVSITDGTVTATGGEGTTSSGVYSNTDIVTISGGIVTATGGEVSESFGVLTKTGKTITISGGTGTAKGNGNAFSRPPEVQNVTLTPNPYNGEKEASWGGFSVYTVTFDPNGGQVAPTTVQTNAEGKLTSLPTPTRSNYTFNGWFTTATGGERVTEAKVYTENTTLYAQWTANESGGNDSGSGSGSGSGGSSGGGDSDRDDSDRDNSGSGSITVPVTGSDTTVKVDVTTSGGAVTVKEPTKANLDKVISAAAKDAKPVEIDLSSLNNDLSNVTLPASTIAAAGKSAADGGVAGLTVKLPNGNAVTFDGAALTSVSSAADGKGLTLSINERAGAKPSAEEAALLGGRAAANIFDLTLKDSDGRTVSDFNGGTATVVLRGIKMTGEPDGYALFHKTGDKLVPQPFTRAATKTANVYDLTLDTASWSSYLLTYEGKDSNFTDVAAGDYFYDAVLWAVEKGVTEGTSATTFEPDMTCSRAQIVTFLWRAMGSPEPTTSVCPFTDVDPGAYYYKAVLWATEKNITVGAGGTLFAPDMLVSRGQTAVLLWRTAGEPAASAAVPFADVTDGAYYAVAAQWAAEQGITVGTSATTFEPDTTCSRAQIVTFLYRYLGR